MTTPEDRKDLPAHDGKDKAAQSLGQRGGRARAKALSARRRKEIAQKAAHALEDIGRPPKTKMVPRPRRSAQQGARGGVRKKSPGRMRPPRALEAADAGAGFGVGDHDLNNG